MQTINGKTKGFTYTGVVCDLYLRKAGTIPKVYAVKTAIVNAMINKI